ncbi:E3 ubiquitin-protein ligase RAD18-like isoform X2 [Prorops nasuta]
MWPLDYMELKRIEDLLTCSICYEFFETSVITPCSHNYCSLCIRRYLHYKTQCPACFEDLFEKDLRINKTLNEILLSYNIVKPKLQKVLLEQKAQAVQNKNFNSTPKSSLSNKVQLDLDISVASNYEDTNISSDSAISCKSLPPVSSVEDVQRTFDSPSTSSGLKVHSFFTPKSKKNDQKIMEKKFVSCPVCKVDVAETHINKHLDDCLKRESGEFKPAKKIEKRKPLPKLVVSLMKDPELRKKLKELGLSSLGDRKTLEMRLQRYIVLFNSECDKDNPRPVSELIKSCEDEEIIEKKVQKTSIINKLKVTRNTKDNVIDEARKQYLATNKDSFQNLIRNLKNSNVVEQSTSNLVLDQSIKSDLNKDEKTVERSGASSDSLENVGSFTYDQFQESDSNLCPLQRYDSRLPSNMNVDFSINENTFMDELDCTVTEESTINVNRIDISKEEEKISNVATATLNDFLPDNSSTENFTYVSTPRQISSKSELTAGNESLQSDNEHFMIRRSLRKRDRASVNQADEVEPKKAHKTRKK